MVRRLDWRPLKNLKYKLFSCPRTLFRGHLQRIYWTPVLCSGSSAGKPACFRTLVLFRFLLCTDWTSREDSGGLHCYRSENSFMSVKGHRSVSSTVDQLPQWLPNSQGLSHGGELRGIEINMDLMLESPTTPPCRSHPLPTPRSLWSWSFPRPCHPWVAQCLACLSQWAEGHPSEASASHPQATSKATQVSRGKAGAKNTEQVSWWDPALLIICILSLITRAWYFFKNKSQPSRT